MKRSDRTEFPFQSYGLGTVTFIWKYRKTDTRDIVVTNLHRSCYNSRIAFDFCENKYAVMAGATAHLTGIIYKRLVARRY